MHILITGGAGFLGQRLAQQLLMLPELECLTLTDIMTPSLPSHLSSNSAGDSAGYPLAHRPKVITQQADLSDPQAVRTLVSADITAVYHLAAIVSGQAETNFDLGMAVNGDGTRYLLEAVRHQAPGARVIFASSLAVFGGDLPPVITDKTAVAPQSSYGTQKAVAELWVADYSRKGFIDGLVLRLPTVCVRPGKPNAAASSFASGIIREPLQGLTAICPVDPQLSLWLSSPEVVTRNLVHSLTLSADRCSEGSIVNRIINLPGLSVTVKAMIDALANVAGPEIVQHIRYEPDAAVSRIVASWPSQFDTRRAQALGFIQDDNFEEIIRAFLIIIGFGHAPYS
jgi:D-erythronate 2-dehydrogenase